jgi:peptidoglycan/xylan/chitin deacetylase (PgdA/CDA1 family)
VEPGGVSAPTTTGRVLTRGLLPAVLVAATRHAAPALTARGPLRRAMPRLSGRGRPGGVGLTFDDGPSPCGTPAVLAALAELRWSATFFLLGSEVQRFPEVARAVVAAGHEIGLHGHDHRNHLTRPASWVRQDLTRARAEVVAATGQTPRWFRPPYGVLSGGSLRAAGSLDLTPVLWTAWGRDWEAIPARRVLDHLRSGLDDGGTVLLHDSDCTSTPGSWRSTVAVLPLLAAELDRRGLRARPLRAHLTRRG